MVEEDARINWSHLYPRIATLSDHLFDDHGVPIASTGIDIRASFHNLMLKWGHWVVLRKMKIGDYSSHYNPLWRESISGPKWNFTDTVTRVRSSSVRKTVVLEGESIWPQGVIPSNYNIFYLDWTTAVTEEDIIFYTSNPEEKPIAPTPPYTDKWDIKAVFPMRGKGGRVEFYSALGFRDTIKE